MWPFKKKVRTPEINSGEQVELPTRLRMQNRDDRIRQMIRHEMFRSRIADEGMETFEEADDFEMEDGEEWVSPYDNEFDPDFDAAPAPPPAQPAPSPAPPPAPAPSQPDKSSAA